VIDGALSVSADNDVALRLTSCSSTSAGNGEVGGSTTVNTIGVPPTVTARLNASKLVAPNDADPALVTAATVERHPLVSTSVVAAPLVIVKCMACTVPDEDGTLTMPV